MVAGATVAGTGLAIRGAKAAAKTAAVQNYKLQLGRAFPKEKGEETPDEQIEDLLTPENKTEGGLGATDFDKYGLIPEGELADMESFADDSDSTVLEDGVADIF